jgi:hypothetical protein
VASSSSPTPTDTTPSPPDEPSAFSWSDLLGFDVLAAFIEWMTFVVFFGWFNVCLRAWRGGPDAEIRPSQRLQAATALLVAIRGSMRANRARANLLLRDSLVEVRGSLRESATDSRDRDKRAAERDQKLFLTTLALLGVAIITLVIAIVALRR